MKTSVYVSLLLIAFVFFVGCSGTHGKVREQTGHTLVETRMDMSVFDRNYQNDETGRRAYDPKILSKIKFFREGFSKNRAFFAKIEIWLKG